MTVKNVSAAAVNGVRLTRYFNGDMDNSGADDLYDRTLDTVWGSQGASGHGLALYARPASVTTPAWNTPWTGIRSAEARPRPATYRVYTVRTGTTTPAG